MKTNWNSRLFFVGRMSCFERHLEPRYLYYSYSFYELLITQEAIVTRGKVPVSIYCMCSRFTKTLFSEILIRVFCSSLVTFRSKSSGNQPFRIPVWLTFFVIGGQPFDVCLIFKKRHLWWSRFLMTPPRKLNQDDFNSL